MKVLLTGISGFVGSSIARKLYHTDLDVTAIVRDKRDLPNEIMDRFRIVQCDISEKVPTLDADVLIHVAGLTSDKIMSKILNKTNVDGTRNLIKACPNLQRMIHVSSASVYNLHPEKHVENESINMKFLGSYGRSKYMAEQMLESEFKDKLDITILRPRAIYGKGDRVILPRIMKLYRRGKIVVPGDLNVHASMTLIDRFTDISLAFLEDQDSGFHIYNVADRKAYTLRKNILSLFESVLGKKVVIDSKNENLVRIFAGLNTVLRPGSNMTQTSIDYITRDHVLDTTKIEEKFPHLHHPDFETYLPEYTRWINTVGLSKIGEQNKRLPWM